MIDFMKIRKTVAVCLMSAFVGLACLAGPASAQDKIVFTDLSWDSVMVHNRVVGFIIKHAYGYDSEYLPGGTTIMFQAVASGDVDVDMEVWVDNMQRAVKRAVARKRVIDLGSNFADSWQGWLVPTYLIKGDPERGIKPVAPDLRTVQDLKKYWKLFKDPEDPTKGRLYGSIAGWSVTPDNERKFAAYGLEDTFNMFIPGSDAALSGTMTRAYRKGKAWVGYYWAPTWALGMYDMTRLEEPAYSDEQWEKDRGCSAPVPRVHIIVNKRLPEKAPELVELLKKYETTTAMNNEFLAHMSAEKCSADETAIWFLKKHPEVWKTWVSEADAVKVMDALAAI
ncbi:ABC transporter substrate-binding protein [Desulfobaculum bizertense]|uniref:ABC transporter substrate-binding protein n=1 Tax=Desulfobaculum bizertense TaxID=376490 RepID=UPI001F1DC1A6|nr:ABC transporter substrate-binding protein [Desulfobaculum bizertense]UIJ38040.1 ABC transporter substrate-binding protein [Desulfobaculum bizertense]